MSNFAKHGYTYHDADVHWSHVGQRKDNSKLHELVLLDLESLRDVGESKANENVQTIYESLESRIGEAVQTATIPSLVSAHPL